MKQKIKKAYEAAQFVHALMCDKDGCVKNVDFTDYEISCACAARGLSVELVIRGVESLKAIYQADIEINSFDPSWGYNKFSIGINNSNSGGICGMLLHFPAPETRNGILMDYWRARGYNDGKNKRHKLILPSEYSEHQYAYEVYYEDGYEEACGSY